MPALLLLFFGCQAPISSPPTPETQTAQTGLDTAQPQTGDTAVSPPAPRWPSVTMADSISCRLGPQGELACWGCVDPHAPEPDRCDQGDYNLYQPAPQAADGEAMWLASIGDDQFMVQRADTLSFLMETIDGRYQRAVEYRSSERNVLTVCTLDGAGVIRCFDKPASPTEWVDSTLSLPAGPYLDMCTSGGLCTLDAAGSVVCIEDPRLPTSGPAQPLLRIECGGGWSAICGLTAGGALVCWGDDRGTGVVTDAPTTGTFIDVAMGGGMACAITSDGEIRCWGDKDPWFGSPGVGLLGIPQDSGYVNLDVGARNTCAIKADGSTTCWGINSYGQTEAPPFP